ncbi:MAG: hypothetical protein QG604_981 [Candidatus Dependentiae bacterium]|nr:hypothetical protein [Candidatus Dependentiae bacterium]
MKKKHIIIGASAAGIGVLSKLRNLAPEDDILCVAAQSEMPFNTCLLANFLSTGIYPTGLYTKPESFFSKNHIDLKLNTFIKQIDRKNNRIANQEGTWYYYDNLFLGIGTQPRTLQTEFSPKQGYFQFHTLKDALEIDTFLRTHRPLTAIVVGAGLSGIECADALTERGVRVTVLDPGTEPLSTLLDETAGEMLEQMMTRAGTTFYASSKVKHVLVEPFTGATAGVLLDNDIELYADMVIAAIGTQSNLELAMQAGASIMSGGMFVNRHMQIEAHNIYCGGDAATVPTTHRYPKPEKASKDTHKSARSCTWPDAIQHGMIAAQAMAGKPVDYAGVTLIMSSHFYDTQVVSTGIPPLRKNASKESATVYQGDNWYHSFVVKNDSLESFFMLGNIRNVGLYRKLVATQEPFDLSILDPLRGVSPVE